MVFFNLCLFKKKIIKLAKFNIDIATHCGAILSTASKFGIKPIDKYKISSMYENK